MLVNANFFRGHRVEIGKVSVESAVGGREIERFEVKGLGINIGSFWEMEAVSSTNQSKCALIPFIAEEMIEADAEDQSDAGESRERRVKLAVFQLGEESGRKAGVTAELDEAHFTAHTEMLELVSDVITIERFLDMWSNHGNRPSPNWKKE